ncbi:MAG TPA: DoxX family protein [Rhodothermales bacterium]|nr:DoxX family protein [Rhodothermales bacterium]
MQNLTSPILERRALAVLRIAVAVLLILHGVARAWLGIVDDFGGFLDSLGFPLGVVIAWIITVVEIAGGLALAAGFFVRPLAIWFAVQLLAGIALVHFSEGWFVVGAGRNGMEYSVLLIVALVLIAWTNVGRKMSGAAGL